MSGYDCRNKWVFSLRRNVASDGADWTPSGRLFQSRGPAMANERSPTVTRASNLRSSQPLWNASAQKVGVYPNFRRFAPKIGYRGNLPWAIAIRRSDWWCPPKCLSWKFGEDRSRIFGDNWSLGWPLKKKKKKMMMMMMMMMMMKEGNIGRT